MAEDNTSSDSITNESVLDSGNDEVMAAALRMSSSGNTIEPMDMETLPELDDENKQQDEAQGENVEEPEAADASEEPADDAEDGASEDDGEAEVEASEEDDGTPEWDREDSGDDDPSDGGQYASPKAKVRLSDGREVKIQDLIEGNMRNDDYTKQMHVVEQAQQQYSQLAAMAQAREQELAQTLQTAIQFQQSLVPQAPDPSLRTEDPWTYMEQKAAHDDAMAELSKVQQAAQQYFAQSQSQNNEQLQQVADQQRAREVELLMMKMPQLSDPAKAASFSKDVEQVASRYGFTPEEIAGIMDHRQLLIAADLARYHRLQANKAEALQRGTAKMKQTAPAQSQAPVLKSGKRTTQVAPVSNEIKQLEARVAADPSDIWAAAELRTAKQRANRARAG